MCDCCMFLLDAVNSVTKVKLHLCNNMLKKIGPNQRTAHRTLIVCFLILIVVGTQNCSFLYYCHVNCSKSTVPQQIIVRPVPLRCSSRN